jgi:hypothetical protein
VPDPIHTFDHRRPVTTIEHLRDDDVANVTESDMFHAEEVLALHDLARDPLAGSFEAFRARVLRNPENRCMHHHVFDTALLYSALQETGWNTLALEKARPLHLVALARKPARQSVK